MTLTDLERLNTQNATPRSVELWKALQPFRSCISFMNTGAHPDDETTSMLAALGLRDGVKLSQACANRGEGGQNAIGVEISKDLGCIRTREMERSAEVINMTHYWLSETPGDKIFDFGFSKSGEETLDRWGEERTLERFVLILRRERPDIICPTFLDISGQHGHHQAMTRSAFKAVILAADPAAFPEQKLPTWQVKKLYLPAWSGAGDAYDDDVPPPPATTHVDGTGADPVSGADYAQIAQYSRSFHRTQGMGRWVEPGQPNIWPLHLAWAHDGKVGSEKSVFDGLPSMLSDLAEFTSCPELEVALTSAQSSLDAAISAWPDAASVRTHAASAFQHISRAKVVCPESAQAEVLHRLSDKQRQIANVLRLSRGIQCRVSISQIEVRPGAKLTLTVHIHATDCSVATVLKFPKNWEASTSDGSAHTISIPANEPTSDPYPDTWYCDRASAPLHVILSWKEGDQHIWVSVDPEERLQVLPAYSANLSQSEAIVNISNPVDISVKISQIYPANATPEFTVPEGWAAKLSDNNLLLRPTAELAEGLHTIPLTIDKNEAQIVRRMVYPHTGPTNRCTPATLRVQVMDVTLPKGRIAYIGGGNDRTDFWLRKLGVQIDSLTEDAVQNVDFNAYDSILIGIFAFRTKPALQARLKDLHAWIFGGGNLVTLYHRPWDNWNPETTNPAYLEIGKPSLRWRVTNENADVRYLKPDHRLLNTPNKITDEDWKGWHKERGLYFAARWDDAYIPLLEMRDANEPPLQGALLSGNFGKGRHTHTSLILHHQVESLTSGAYKLLANLLHT